MIIKRISAIAFVISFLAGIILFTDFGKGIMSFRMARNIFMISGGIAIFLNLINFQQSKHNPIFTIIYWTGSIITFFGAVFYIMHWPYSMEIFVGGITLTGISFFIPNQKESEENQSDIIDDF